MKVKSIVKHLMIAFCFLSVSCSTSTFSVRSNPDKATVKVNRLGGTEVIDIGQTPIDMSAEDFIQKLGGDTPFVLNIEKDGYQAIQMIVTGLPNSNISLNQNLEVSSGFDDQVKTNEIIEGIFEAQRLARAKRFNDALNKINETKARAPHLAVLYELEGGIYYIEAKYTESLDAYIKALQYSPTSAEALQMLVVLEEDHGIKRIPDDLVTNAQPTNLGQDLPQKNEDANREPAQSTGGQ